MSQIECRQVSFRYPKQEQFVLNNINFSIEAGEMAVLCGKSGCGKSTLLRLMKACQVPAGEKTGKISLAGEEVENIEKAMAAQKIGFVGQNPEAQIVTDTVWHELAFGLESLGIPNHEMQRRIAEIAEYFGMREWFDKPTDQLSGGQKQILNLAAVMIMRPQILLLDEPTSQLDPIGAERFLHTLKRINKNFGVTILLSEQCLEEVLPIVDRVFLLQDGELAEVKNIRETGKVFYEKKSEVFHALPIATRLFVECKQQGEEPWHVSEAVEWLGEKNDIVEKVQQIQTKQKKREEKEPVVLEAKQLAFTYDKKQPYSLQDCSLKIHKNSISAILGGNGVGKTTALKVLAGIYAPQKGKRIAKGKVVYLPQDPQLLFTEPTVCEELEVVFVEQSKKYANFSEDEIVNKVKTMLEFMELLPFQGQHPFDLSGGQQQRLAIAKLLLLEPDILLLDEPTKGLDAAFKHKLGELLERLTMQGKTIVFVSHDVEFCAEYANYCGLLFRGTMLQLEPSKEFFAKNYFYTPAVHRIFQYLYEPSEIINYKQAMTVLRPLFGLEGEKRIG